MKDAPRELRRGWTTGACATAALKAALTGLWSGEIPKNVTITLPRGERPSFKITHCAHTPGESAAGVIKDAGDDPDVTHGALIVARVREGAPGLRFHAGEGVGVVTKPGLPIAPGEAAINPSPRQMMREAVEDLALKYGKKIELHENAEPSDGSGLDVTIAIPGGEELARKTWNPRLGIRGGLSVLGTTGIVRPYSCSAWIASIHRGIDVARASGLDHVAGCTGATSEQAVRTLHHLPEEAMLDMGDFVGGLVKYLRRHPVARLTIGGGIAKLTKLAQGAVDLHSARTQVDMDRLARWLGDPDVMNMNSVLEVYEKHGDHVSAIVAERAREQVRQMLANDQIAVDVAIVERSGRIVARSGP